MTDIDPTRWTVASADAQDIGRLRGLDGHALAVPGADDLAWVARARPGGPAVATLRLCPGGHDADPRAWFRLGWSVHAATDLQLYRRQRTLLLCHDLTGADALSGFAADASLDAAEAASAWTALVQVALGALAQRPGAERRACIAQLPGVRDAAGQSPVWQALGRHFHAQDPDAARRQHGPGWEHEVASLLPRHLVYASLLPAAAQVALGQSAPAAEALRQALLRAGFGWREHVGLVDGGPVLERWPPGF